MLKARMEAEQIVYTVGIPESYRDSTAVLYDIAFGDKVALGVPDKNKRLKLLKSCMLLEYAIGAFYKDQLVGIAGFHTRDGHLTGGKLKLSDMMTLLGLWEGIKAAMVLSVFSRKPDKNELLMDGITVAPSGRGIGIGSNLLMEIIKYAKKNDFISVRLDVIDTNPNAKRLYNRMGFKVTKTNSFPRLKKYLGFGGADTMIYEIKKA